MSPVRPGLSDNQGSNLSTAVHKSGMVEFLQYEVGSRTKRSGNIKKNAIDEKH